MSKENDLFARIKEVISLQNTAIMSGVELGRKESEAKIKTLESVNAKLLEALKAHEAWEEDLILNGDWSSETGRLTQNQHDKLSDVQDLRNEAIKEVEGKL